MIECALLRPDTTPTKGRGNPVTGTMTQDIAVGAEVGGQGQDQDQD